MSFCPNCNIDLGNAPFCSQCGARAPEPAPIPEPTTTPVFCTNCGQAVISNSLFCDNCGTPVSQQAPVAPVASEPAPQKVKLPSANGKLLKLIPLVAVGVVAVIAIVAGISLIGGSSNNPQVFYIQDDELMFTDLEMEEAMEISSRLYSDGISDSYSNALLSNYVSAMTSVTADESIIVYPDRIEDDSTALYYRSLTDSEASSEKIDSDIKLYALDPAGTYIIYQTTDNDLYYYDFTDKDRIDSDVSTVAFSEDQTQFMYTVRNETDDGYTYDLYLCAVGGESEKLGSGLSSVVKYNDDLSVFIWKKDNALYRWDSATGESEKFASDVTNIVSSASVDNIYYTKTEDATISLSSLVNDDLKSSDATISTTMEELLINQPNWPEEMEIAYWTGAISEEEYSNAFDEYYTTYDAWRIEYDALYSESQLASARDDVRDYLNTATYETEQTILYYYQGEESVEVLSDYNYISNSSSDGSALLVYTSSLETASYKMSDLVNDSNYYYRYSADDYVDFIYNDFSRTSTCYLVQAGVSAECDEEITGIIFNSDGTRALYMEDVEDNEGDLYMATLSNATFSEATLVDSDVSTYSKIIVNDTSVIYYKDLNDSGSTGDLYMDGTRISYDVDMYSTNVSLREDVIYYTVDRNDNGEYTLYQYANGESTKIADDMYSYTIGSDDLLYYYTDYETDRNSGTLYRQEEDGNVKIDSDVHSYTITSDGRLLYLYDYSSNSYEGILCQYDAEEGRIRLEDDVQILVDINDSFVKSYYLY